MKIFKVDKKLKVDEKSSKVNKILKVDENIKSRRKYQSQ
jgi:hypothetical protein